MRGLARVTLLLKDGFEYSVHLTRREREDRGRRCESVPAPMPKVPITDRSVSDAVARILGRQFRAAGRALDRNDAEALHDFRVALRRARAILRAFRPWLPSLRRKDRRRLRKLARATNVGRDAEVLLPLLRRFADELPRELRADLAPLRRQLRRVRRDAWSKRVGDLRAGLGDAARALRRRLRREQRLSLAFGPALGALLADEAARLAGEVAALRSSNTPAAFHAARLTAKRARYLVEPLGRSVTGAESLVTRLSELQTAFGDLHDLDVLLAVVRDELRATGKKAPGLRALETRIATHRRAFTRDLHETWVDERAPALADDLAGLARRLAEPGRATAAGGRGGG